MNTHRATAFFLFLTVSFVAHGAAAPADKSPFDKPAAAQTVTDSFSIGKIETDAQRKKLERIFARAVVDFTVANSGRLVPMPGIKRRVPSRGEFLAALKSGQTIVVIIREDRPPANSPDAKTTVPTDVKYSVSW